MRKRSANHNVLCKTGGQWKLSKDRTSIRIKVYERDEQDRKKMNVNNFINKTKRIAKYHTTHISKVKRTEYEKHYVLYKSRVVK